MRERKEASSDFIRGANVANYAAFDGHARHSKYNTGGFILSDGVAACLMDGREATGAIGPHSC